ncbi:MAG: hypothetical protein AB7L09_03375 [Nitrospira sp.]
MSPYLVIGYSEGGSLRVYSAYASAGLAKQAAEYLMSYVLGYNGVPYTWELNPSFTQPRPIAAFPGRAIQGWTNKSWSRDNSEPKTLLIVELYVSGTLLDRMAEV